jgi:tRNA-dihydrouridine synthase
MNQPLLSLGPFQGITDAPFRNVFKRHFGGIDKFYTPFFTGIQKDHAKNLQVEEIDPRCNDVETLTPQILSTDAEEVLRFAKQCKQLGYKEINLNMGCPFPRVANKKRGCGLLPYPDKVEAMFERIFEEIDIRFSVKCRLGYFSPDEINAILPIFNRFPISELIIHPRIGKQLYKGEADVERFKALIPEINAPLVYNGDIVSVERFEGINGFINDGPSTFRQAQGSGTCKPVDQFMLGRGLLANPFLAEQIKNVASQQGKKERLYAYVLDLYEDRLRHAGGSPKVLGRMKELWSYLMNAFDEPQDVWRKIKKINALKEYKEQVDYLFRQHEVTL